jgi:citrate lyase beta subunit
MAESTIAESLPSEALEAAVGRLRDANVAFARRYPGESGRRQPVHTVYGGAHLFRSDSTAKIGGVARRALEEYAPDPGVFAQALGLADGDFAEALYARVAEKLAREPVEDFRIDFEDGYGNRPDTEEDGHAVSVAGEVAKGMQAGTLPPFLGIRIKPLNEELRERSVRTLDLFLTALLERTGGTLPANFVVTLPKIVIVEQVTFFADVLDTLEKRLGLEAGTLVFESMVEMPQAIVGETGRFILPLLPEAARGRMIAAHFGTYDYTAGVGITAAHQRMQHPACDFAKHVMQIAYAGTGIWLSDGSTAILPVPVHRAPPGSQLTGDQERENRDSIHRAWRLHFDDVRHSLVNGFYQGWDLHPAQLPTRYAAVFAFFLEAVDAAGERLRNFVQKAAQATLVGDVFDDAATGQGLLNYFARGINCGALTEEEALQRTDLSLEELRGRSFVKILRNRQG